jgi:MFS family permease
MLFGAALCGISAGVFWMAEAAIAIAYPEPWNRGKALGYWLTYRLSGQILGGAINLGLNADRDEAGKVSYTVFLIFIALQATGPLVGLLLNSPSKVERKDGKKVSLAILQNPWWEIKETTRLFFSKNFLLLLLFIGQAVFAEAVFFTYLARKEVPKNHQSVVMAVELIMFAESVVYRPVSRSWLLLVRHRGRDSG